MKERILRFFIYLIALSLFFTIFIGKDTLVANSRILTIAWQKKLASPQIWFFSLLILIGVSLAFSILLNRYYKRILKSLNYLDFTNKKIELIIFPLMAIFIYFINYFAFNARPHIIDSIVQLYQSKLFLAGKIVLPLPENWYFFLLHNILVTEEFWASQYLPGQSIIYTFGYLINNLSLIPSILSIGSVYYLFKLTKLLFDLKTARVAIFLQVISPFFLFLGASYKEHLSVFFFLVCFCYYQLKWLRESKLSFFVFAITALGFALNIRPLNAIIFSLIFLLPSTKKVFKDKNFKLIPLAILLVSILLIPSFIYNYNITGSIFNTGFIKNWGAGHSLGFHEDPWGRDFTFYYGVVHQLMNLTLFNEYVFYGLIPALLPIAIFFIFKKEIKKAAKFLLFAFILTPIIFIFYWHTDFYLGPRFLYEGLIFYFPLIAHILVEVNQSVKERFVYGLSLELFFKIALLVALIVQIFFGVIPKTEMYKRSMKNFKFSLADLLEEKQIKKALVFVKVSWGSRIISKLRSFELPNHMVEISYKNVDHCKLQEWVDYIEKQNLSKKEIYNEFFKIYTTKGKVPIVRINGDRSLRLSLPLKLSKKCRDELTYDDLGIDIFAPYMLVNQADLKGDIVVAKDMKDWNYKLISEYPNYNRYFFVNKKLYTEKEYEALVLKNNKNKF